MVVIFWFLYICVAIITFIGIMAFLSWDSEDIAKEFLFPHAFLSGIISAAWPLGIPFIVLSALGYLVVYFTQKIKKELVK